MWYALYKHVFYHYIVYENNGTTLLISIDLVRADKIWNSRSTTLASSTNGRCFEINQSVTYGKFDWHVANIPKSWYHRSRVLWLNRIFSHFSNSTDILIVWSQLIAFCTTRQICNKEIDWWIVHRSVRLSNSTSSKCSFCLHLFS